MGAGNLLDNTLIYGISDVAEPAATSIRTITSC